MNITILIPAFNEEKNIEKTLSGIENFYNDFCKEMKISIDVIVIDDCSEDKTSVKAEKKGQR